MKTTTKMMKTAKATKTIMKMTRMATTAVAAVAVGGAAVAHGGGKASYKLDILEK